MKVVRIESLDAAIQYLTQNPESKIVAGGTDLIPRLNQKLENQDNLCCLENIPQMLGIKKDDNFVFVGALTKLVEISKDKTLSNYSALIQAASKVASPQIRNQATIGGNILQENRCMYFNQSVPWSDINLCFKRGGNKCYQYKNSKECVALFQSDIAPALIAFSATALIQGIDGQREIPVKDLYFSAVKKNIKDNEILIGIKIPLISDSTFSAYERKTFRGSFDFPLISCAVFIIEKKGLIEKISVVLGAAGVKPAEVKEIIPLCEGKSLTQLPEIASGALKIVAKHTVPFKDTRVNGSVRKDMVKTVFINAVKNIIPG